MRQTVLKALYDLHSWIGVTVGLLLYVVCFSGVAALFTEELEPWVRGDARAPAAYGPVLDEAAARVGAGAGTFTILLPTPYRHTLTIERRRSAPLHLDPHSGAEVAAAPEGPNGLLTRLHTELLLPSPAGLYVVGGLGIVMLVSIASGVLLHRKLIGELFTLRLRRSRRLRWTDLHKSVGLWGLPFHTVMALTGVVLGFSSIAIPIAAGTAFGGDLAAAFAAMATANPQPVGTPATMLPVSQLLGHARAAVPGFEPEVLIVHHYGDAGGVLEAMGNRAGGLVYYLSVAVNAASGEVAGITDWSREAFGRRLYAMVTPLHYASYGGFALKALYAALGAGTCFVILSGLKIHRTRADGERGVLPRLVAAVVHGLPLASAGLFWLHAVAAPVGTATFLALWGGAALWPLAAGPRAARGMLGVTGGLLATLPLPGMVNGGTAAILSIGGRPLLVTMVVAAVLGGVLLWVALRPPRAGRDGRDGGEGSRPRPAPSR